MMPNQMGHISELKDKLIAHFGSASQLIVKSLRFIQFSGNLAQYILSLVWLCKQSLLAGEYLIKFVSSVICAGGNESDCSFDFISLIESQTKI